MATLVTADSKQGRRDYQEDVYRVVNLNDGRVMLLVCDGHGGSRCGIYCAGELEKELRALKPGDWDLKGCVQAVSNRWDQVCLDALEQKHMPRTAKERQLFFEKANYDQYCIDECHSGTTVALALLDLTLRKGCSVHVGDSRVIYKALRLRGARLSSSRDHKPSLAHMGPIAGVITQEKEDEPRINGDLAVGRALGDNSRELMGTVADKSTERHWTWEAHQPLVVAVTSDGIHEGLSNSEVIQLPNAHAVVDAALRKGSSDNVTCVMLTVPASKTPPVEKKTKAVKKTKTRRARQPKGRPHESTELPAPGPKTRRASSTS
jgi:serine/threonine protein phosphatase PrpC